MVLSKVYNDWNKHWESLFLVSLQNIQEIIVFEEAHRSICNLKMNTSNTLNNSLEKFWDEMFDLIDFTDFEDLSLIHI